MITHPVTTYAMTQQDSSPSNLRYPAWQREFEASLHEPDPKTLVERVPAGEAAIFNRLPELEQTSRSTDHEIMKLKSSRLRKRSERCAL
jgi:hypothetical protein